VWPRVAPATKKDAAAAGPTGDAWVDSNAWVIRLAQVYGARKECLADASTAGRNEVTPLDSFVKPVAEAGAFGGIGDRS